MKQERAQSDDEGVVELVSDSGYSTADGDDDEPNNKSDDESGRTACMHHAWYVDGISFKKDLNLKDQHDTINPYTPTIHYALSPF